MKTKKSKILVLSDLKENAGNVIKNTTTLAKIIHGQISLFHVKNPLGVVKNDNQLSAVRNMNANYLSTENQIDNLVSSISKSCGLKIETNFTIGNVKEEITNQIGTLKPDIIVIGKRKNVPIKILGDSITQFVMSVFDGPVIISSQDQILKPNQELSLGIFNANEQSFKTNLAEELLRKTSKPLLSFKITKENNTSSLESVLKDKKVVEFAFEHGDNVLNTVSKYLTKRKVDVLLVENDQLKKDKKTHLTMKDFIGKINVPLMLTGRPNLNLQ